MGLDWDINCCDSSLCNDPQMLGTSGPQRSSPCPTGIKCVVINDGGEVIAHDFVSMHTTSYGHDCPCVCSR